VRKKNVAALWRDNFSIFTLGFRLFFYPAANKLDSSLERSHPPTQIHTYMSRKAMERINSLSRAEALAAFKACCGSAKYAEVACPCTPCAPNTASQASTRC